MTDDLGVQEVIVGRDDQLAGLREFAAAATRGRRALVLEGDAGIGKTTLWHAGARLARDSGVRVLASRAAGSEVNLSFVVLGDLLADALEPSLRVLPRVQRRALEAALLVSEDAAEVDYRAVGLAATAVLRTVAADEPLLLALDDLQWVDAASARVLDFALRRLTSDRISVLATCRRGELAPSPLDLHALLGDELSRVSVGPLHEAQLHKLLTTRLGVVLPRPLLLQLAKVTGGNPFYALEVGRALAARDELPAPGEPLPVPEGLLELVGARLRLLPQGVRGTLLVVAALSQPTCTLVCSASQDAERTADHLDLASAAGVVSFDGDRIRFTHPLLAAALYGSTPTPLRRRLHRTLATAVEDPEERARHLAIATTTPDDAVAAVIAGAARRAHRRGAPDGAAELAEHALRLTPAERDDLALERAWEAAEYHFESGNLVRAKELLEQVVQEVPSGTRRAQALARLAWWHGWWGDEPARAVQLLRQAAADVASDELARADVGEAYAWAAQLVGDPELALQEAARAVECAQRAEAPPRVYALALMAHAYAQARLGDPSSEQTVERAVAVNESFDDREPALALTRLGDGRVISNRMISNPRWVRSLIRAGAGDLDGARVEMASLHRLALEHGDESSIPNLAEHLALLELRAGNWEQAEAVAAGGYDAAVRTQQAVLEVSLLRCRALLAAQRGIVHETTAAADAAGRLARRLGLDARISGELAAVGLLELSRGEPRAADEALAPLLEGPLCVGVGEQGWLRFAADEAEAMLALGRTDDAAALADRLESEPSVLDHAWLRVGRLRIRGLVTAARGETVQAVATLELARREAAQLGEPYELGRTLLALGRAQRAARQQRDARDTLTAAESIFDTLGASLWRAQAAAELRRIGGRRTATSQLTPTEARVAELVATGYSNHEVAAALYVSAKTVEWNLSKIFRKLNVRSRTELAAKLAAKGRAG